MAVWIVRVLDGEDPPVVTQTRFNDVDAAGFYAPFVERMADLGVTGGCGDGSGYCPDATVTRWQMAVFLSRAYDLPEGPDPGFSDVPADVWYAPAVARLTASGITSGCGDGTGFCPAGDTTRAQMATFLWRAENRADAASYKALTAGLVHTCAIGSDDTIACWGNVIGQADAPSGTFKAVAAGQNHTCAIGSDDSIACWGDNQLSQTEAPQGTFKAVAAGQNHTCAIGSDGAIACWGDTRSAEGRELCEELVEQLGLGSCDWPGSGATDAPSGSFKAVAAGGTHTCAIGSDDTIACWGRNFDGRADAPSGSFKAVSAGGSHTCAIASDDTIACWGNNQAQPDRGTPRQLQGCRRRWVPHVRDRQRRHHRLLGRQA